MKKILLGTTAMMTAGLIVSGAQAEGINLSVNGYYTAVVSTHDNDPQLANVKEEDVTIQHEGELSFNGNTTLDNGLTVGVEANLEIVNNNGTGGQFDEVFAYVEGSFGRVEIGENGSAAFQMHISAPYFVGSHGADSPNFSHNGVGNASRTASYITVSGDTAKITYFTPVISGAQLGISYTPESLFGDVGGQFPNFGTGAGVGNQFNGTLEDTIEVGATWSGDFEGVAIGVSGGYFTADIINNNGAFNNAKDPDAWSAGLSLSSAGFTLAGGYYSSDDLVATGTEEEAYSVGLQYVTGPWTVGAAYFASERDVAAVAGSNNADFEVVELGATYNLGAGIDVFGVVELYDTDFDGAGAAANAETDAFGVGIDLAF